MPRLYAATGDAIARLDEAEDAWAVELSLHGSGAQCLATDPADADIVYAGLREHGLRKTADGGPARAREAPWGVLAGGLPEPVPGMPYALVAADDRLFAGLADRQVWEGVAGGDRWRACTLRGDTLTELHALAWAG